MNEFLIVHMKYLVQNTNRRINVSNLISILHVRFPKMSIFEAIALSSIASIVRFVSLVAQAIQVEKYLLQMQIILNILKYGVLRRNIASKSLEYTFNAPTLRYVLQQNNLGRTTNRCVFIRPREIALSSAFNYLLACFRFLMFNSLH